MGCPEISYNEMCYEADRNIRKREKIDDTVDIREIEKRLKNAVHDSMFYYNCGIAVANIINEIMNEDNTDGFNAALGGMASFEYLIGLRNNKGSYIKTECTVGDTVYVPFRDTIQEMTIIGIIYDGVLVYYKWDVKDDKGIFPWLDGFPEHNLGSTVFLSKEEAKKSTSLKNI